jgi:hypothetical protein
MRLLTTVLVGALASSGLLVSLAGCSDDDDPPANPGGAGGTGGSAGRGGSGGTGGSTGGSGGSTGGTSGSGGSGGMACMETPDLVAGCKARGADAGTGCEALTTCACEACVCELQACENNTACKGIRECAQRTSCCSPVDTQCTAKAGAVLCTEHPECGPLITNAGTEGTQLISAVSVCVYSAPPSGGGCSNTVCSADGGGGTSGTGGTGGGDGGVTGGTGGTSDAGPG